MRPNEGRLPEECIIRDDAGNITGYHKVRIMLFVDDSIKQARERAPWPSGALYPPQTDWTISDPPHDYQIRKWEIV